MATRRRVVDAARKRSAPEIQEIRVLVLHDEDPDTSWMDDDENEDRRQEYERGNFTFVGVVAEADLTVEGTTQTIRSGGICGVEGDDKEYIESVADDEYADLRKILKTMGVATSELPNKLEKRQIKWRA
jgi:hypothetical protein